MNYNKIINKFKKNSKGLSPVVASIILIAVTVAVSVVVAAWMGGMTIGLMGNAEQATITNIDTSVTPIHVTVQNTGDAVVELKAGYINDVQGALAAVTGTLSIAKGETATVSIVGDIPNVGDDITVKITTSSGNNLVLTKVVDVIPAA